MTQQPSSLHCFVCGVENSSGLHMQFYETDTSPVEVVAEYTIPEHFQGYPGIVHGGIVAAVLDEAISRTIFRGEPLRYVVTSRLSIRYRKPVLVGTPIRVIARVVEDKGKVVKVSGEIKNQDDVILAEGEAVLFEVSPDFFGDLSIEDQTWKVYPDKMDEKDYDR